MGRKNYGNSHIEFTGKKSVSKFLLCSQIIFMQRATEFYNWFCFHLHFHRLAQTVKLAVSLGLLMTYPLQMFVAVQIMWSPIEEKFGPLKYPIYSQLLFRALLVLATCKYFLKKHSMVRRVRSVLILIFFFSSFQIHWQRLSRLWTPSSLWLEHFVHLDWLWYSHQW